MAVSQKKPRKHTWRLKLCIIGGLLVYGVLSYWLVTSFFLEKGTLPTLSFPTRGLTVPSPSPSPSPRPIPSGKKTFSVSSGKKTGPLFGEGAIDPYDPKMKGVQTISVTIASVKPVTEATLTMQTDTKTKKVPMQIITGTSTNGV